MADMYLRVEFRYVNEELTDDEWNHIKWDANFWFGKECAELFDLMGMDSKYPGLMRGCPPDISVETQIAAGVIVRDDENGYDNEYTREQAEGLVKYGLSFYLSKWKNLISDPDYKQFSWCTYPELKERINKWMSTFNTPPEEYDDFCLQLLGLLEYMRILESTGKCMTRAVYWFSFCS